MKHRVAIFGGGRVGTAMSLEMPGVPVVGRGYDCRCDVACLCWPAQAVREFASSCPLAASTAHVVAFCNGAWAVEDGADEHGCCYVRAVNRGDRAAPGRKGWRVGSHYAALVLAEAGLLVTRSRSPDDHSAQVWSKCLYIVPLALASADTGEVAKVAARTSEYSEWYDVVRAAAVAAVGEEEVARHEPRVRFLVERSPKEWRPSSSPEELAYLRERLCVE